jgi:glutamine synthetase
MIDWLRYNPGVKTIRVAAADLNGQARGKRIPVRFAEKIVRDGTRFPYSVLNLDIWGEDIEDSPLVFAIRRCRRGAETHRARLHAHALAGGPTALLPIWMFHEDGTPFPGDPRHALAAVVQRFHARACARSARPSWNST